MKIFKRNKKPILKTLWRPTYEGISFIVLTILYSFTLLLNKLGQKTRLLRSISVKFSNWVKSLDKADKSGVSSLYLIEISFKNMAAKKTRTIVTIGGMAIGISFIVFLVSVGYGLQQLVISRVARLDELKQAEVVPGLSTDLSLTDATLAKFKQITNVTDVLPLIAVVGRVSYQNSVSDIAVYGATADYLKYSALQPVKGNLFESNTTAYDTTNMPMVMGVSSVAREVGEEIGDVEISIAQGVFLKVRELPDTSSPIIGYTKRIEGSTEGVEVWGESFESNSEAGQAGETAGGVPLGKWVKSSYLLWDKEDCDGQTDGDCEEGGYLVARDSDNAQIQQKGYVAEISMTVTPEETINQVLGVNTDEAEGSLPVVEIASESASINEQNVEKVEINSEAKKQIVVNRSVLQLLNISENEAIGRELDLAMVVVGELLDDPSKRVESAPLTYTIVGVIADEGTPIIYVPFIDVRSMGVNKFSQTKVIVDDKSNLTKVRSTIESAGYGTVSVADTVAQIDSLFANFRLLLSILGMVALSVAALGMFNTLTVSLLERTREVGLMKAMGMKSDEVKSLFLTESMIMGLYGGILGLVLGLLIGKVLSFILSALSIVKGVGFVDISYVPPMFVVAVIFLSLLVGIATGYFPAKRATKISALNALRYE
ncbi:MAG: FtsX-like permease family protein [Candidatus Pacebacteria bacterium]|mgnify:FL=1|nr:FtsX-like permease family protein [Candidatus Paceibacterota bacterium]MBT3511694.1 FtsX-like permease family protein [Candidatus Paceibacterota bacterium]MBT7183260.1 FtsX-like permease family protein [Candidatus Paceibacterota bacterium]MBT7338501.1 FtsX-like permease family protein [Candidatus Jacksonbacteria bacterium]